VLLRDPERAFLKPGTAACNRDREADWRRRHKSFQELTIFARLRQIDRNSRALLWRKSGGNGFRTIALNQMAASRD
jgi:hypothetical protein